MTEDEPSFTCPCCGRTSYNLNDVAHAFCGYCRWFTEDGLPCPYHTRYRPRQYHLWRQVLVLGINMALAGLAEWHFGLVSLAVTIPLCLAFGMATTKWVWTR